MMQEQQESNDALRGITTEDILQKLTFIESLNCSMLTIKKPADFKFSRLKVTRGEVLKNAFMISVYLHILQFINILIAPIGFAYLHETDENRQEETKKHTADEAEEEVEYLLAWSLASISATMTCILFIHLVEKADINYNMKKEQAPKSTLFRKAVINYPLTAAFMSDLLIAFASRSFEEEKNVYLNDVITQYIFCVLGLRFAIAIIQNDYLKLSLCVKCLNAAVATSLPYAQSCGNRIATVASTLNPYLLSCIRKTEKITQPVVNDIENYLNENSVDESAVNGGGPGTKVA